MIYIILQLIIIIGLAPLMNGIIRKIKAISQKRKGASVFQMYYDISKLMRKDMVVSDTASWIYTAAPYVVFGSTVAAALLVPVCATEGWLNSAFMGGDALVFLYTLALGRFFLMLAGLDTGSTFGGMGSSREGLISSLLEPSMLIGLFTLGLASGSLSISRMMAESTAKAVPVLNPAYIVIFIVMIIVLLAETCRIPVDDPATHLELTMVHEAMILEYSGRQLALMELAASVKQLIIMTLIVNMFFPITFALPAGAAGVALAILLYAARVMLLSVLIGIVEVCTVKLRFFSVPNLAAIAFILALFGFVNYFVLGR